MSAMDASPRRARGSRTPARTRAALAATGLFCAPLLLAGTAAAAPGTGWADGVGPAASSAVLTAPAPSGTAPGAALPVSVPDTRLTQHLTDDAGILDDDAAQAVIDKVSSEHNLTLWVVTYSDTSTNATAFGEQVTRAMGLGSYDALLVIDLVDEGSPSNSFYFGAGTGSDSPVSDSQRARIQEAVRSALSEHDYDAAVAAVSDTLDSSGGLSSAATLGIGAIAVGGGAVAVGAVASSRRRKKVERQRMEAAQVSLAQLRTQAGAALVTTDDAVRAAAEELSYAQAQFGLTATDSFGAALARAQEHVTRSFELRKQLDDEIPETEPQQRAMLTEILQRCQAASQEITAQEAEFSSRRGIEANLPTSLAETGQRADETAQSIAAARTLLTTLQATYPASALTTVAQAPDQAERLLAAGRAALEQAQVSVQAGQEPTAVEQVRIAQGSIAQAGQLAAQVTGARERLATAGADLERAIASISSDLVDARRLGTQLPASVLTPLVADAEAAVAQGRAAQRGAEQGAGADGTVQGGDPLAALDHLARAEAAIDAALTPARVKEENDARARVALEGRLRRLGSQVDAVTQYVTTNRGAVGPGARTSLSEAARHAATASTLAAGDPTAALTHVEAGERLVSQAQNEAEADVRRHRDSTWSGGAGGRGGGIDVGSLVLGGILLGGRGGGYGGWGGGSRGGGGFSGGGFGGGGFGGGGGGGGFSGGGGSF